MLKHLAERCHKTKAPSLAGTRASFHPHCAALAAFASLYQSGHTPTRSHPSYLHALAARLACGKGPPPEYLPRLNLTIGPRDRAFKRLRRRHRCMCPRLALVGFGWVMGCLKCSAFQPSEWATASAVTGSGVAPHFVPCLTLSLDGARVGLGRFVVRDRLSCEGAGVSRSFPLDICKVSRIEYTHKHIRKHCALRRLKSGLRC